MGKLPILFVSCLFLLAGSVGTFLGIVENRFYPLIVPSAILAGASLIAIAITLAHPPWPPEK